MLTRRSLGRITLFLALVTAVVFLAVPRPSVAAKAGGRLIFAARQDIDTLDPHITNRAATRKILIQVIDTRILGGLRARRVGRRGRHRDGPPPGQILTEAR